MNLNEHYLCEINMYEDSTLWFWNLNPIDILGQIILYCGKLFWALQDVQ